MPLSNILSNATQVTMTQTGNVNVTIASSGTAVSSLGPSLVSVTNNLTLQSSNNGTRYNNLGATGNVALTLPAPGTVQPGWTIALRVAAPYQLNAVCQGTDVIQYDAQTTGAPGAIQSSTVGSSVILEYQGGGVWFAMSVDGMWDFTP